MGTLYVVVILAVLLTELYAVPTSTFSLNPSQQQALAQRPQPAGGQGTTQGGEAAAEEREQINSVSVSCHPDSLEIVVQADLFGVGTSVRSSDVRLGVDNDGRCKATPSSREEYRITAGLLDCGTKHWMTQDSLVYTNLLIYSPEPPAGGVVRMEEAVIPIECHYVRKYSLSSPALSPTWIPFVSTLSSVEELNFDLKIFTPDWLYLRGTNVFYIGEDIHVEASVRPGHHIGLRVFLNTCVATLTPDEHSLPRYVFIENGCLFDSQLPNSRSQFLSRIQDDKLRLVLDAFRFHNEDRGELYITCHVTAVPVHDADAPNKACTYINGRWRSADGNDYLCGYCQPQNEEHHIQDKPSSHFRPRGFGGPEGPERLFRSGLKTEPELDMKAKIGPIVVLPNEKIEPQLEIPLYGSAWRSGVHQKIGLLDNEVDETEDLIENVFTDQIADKGLVPEELSSPVKNPENIIETDDDFHLNATYNDAGEDESPEEGTDADDHDVFSEKQVQVLEFLGNKTTPDPSDFYTSPVFSMNTTTSMNSTDYALADSEEEKINLF